MPPTLALAPHLSSEALRNRYLSSTDPAERTRWHGLWLVSEGKTGVEAAHLVGRSSSWISALVVDYSQHGPDVVPRASRGHARWGGKQPSLDVDGLKAFCEALDRSPPTGGLWTGKKAALWITQYTGKKTSEVTDWRYLTRVGYSRQAPRPAHPEAASPEEQEAYKKKSLS